MLGSSAVPVRPAQQGFGSRRRLAARSLGACMAAGCGRCGGRLTQGQRVPAVHLPGLAVGARQLLHLGALGGGRHAGRDDRAGRHLERVAVPRLLGGERLEEALGHDVLDADQPGARLVRESRGRRKHGAPTWGRWRWRSAGPAPWCPAGRGHLGEEETPGPGPRWPRAQGRGLRGRARRRRRRRRCVVARGVGRRLTLLLRLGLGGLGHGVRLSVNQCVFSLTLKRPRWPWDEALRQRLAKGRVARQMNR